MNLKEFLKDCSIMAMILAIILAASIPSILAFQILQNQIGKVAIIIVLFVSIPIMILVAKLVMKIMDIDIEIHRDELEKLIPKDKTHQLIELRNFAAYLAMKGYLEWDTVREIDEKLQKRLSREVK